MIIKREAEDRGQINLDWLKSRHSFSFGSYYDPNWTGFGHLRVLNEDLISASSGFPTHFHKNMEIITFVIEGEIEHKDNLGNTKTLKPGQIQVMSAGSGVSHSEMNKQKDEKSRMLQIWIEPNVFDQRPSYKELTYEALEHNEITLVPKGHLKQDAQIKLASLHQSSSYSIELDLERSYWVQMISGEIKVNKLSLRAGDGIGLTEEALLKVESQNKSQFLIFDLPKI